MPVRQVSEQHVRHDLGWISTVKDWRIKPKLEPWMTRTAYRPPRYGEAANNAPTTTEPATDVD